MSHGSGEEAVHIYASDAPDCMVCLTACKWVRYEVPEFGPGAMKVRWCCPQCEPSIYARNLETAQ